MAANFTGGTNANPGAYSEVDTIIQGASAPGGVRIAALVGEGSRFERLVASAVGGGSDGFNAAYTSTNGSDGRHFQLSLYPLISNRTVIYKNGVPLTGAESAFSSTSGSFSSSYDYRLDISTGRFELQVASLVDQGGKYFAPNASNTGTGTIVGLALVDEDAPTETWTVRCTSVIRDGYGAPIDGYARFIAQGSVSGVKLDGYGNVVSWQSNGVTVDNGILSFNITEGATKFREGDKFTVKVKSGALVKGDSLTVTYIPEIDLNDPQFFTDIDQIKNKHGSPSLSNRLSLGAQIAFANSPPGVYTVQAAPAVPRRVSYVVEESATGNASIDDLEFPLPVGVIPDSDSNINFFITDPITGVESQVIPNKVAFYDSAITASPVTFCLGASYAYSYTVVLEDSVQKAGEDGVLAVLTGTTASLASTTAVFGQDDISGTRSVKILAPSGQAGIYPITGVSNGKLTIFNAGGFSAATGVRFEVLDSVDTSAQILLTDDLALALGQTLRVTVVDTKDATFFDANWTSALEALETIECDIVVPLPAQTISAIFQSTRTHCETMSNINNRKERVLFCGAINGLTPDNVIGNTPAAVEDIGVLEGIQGDDVTEILSGSVEDLTDYSISGAFGNTFRVVYFYPDQIVVQIGSDRVKVDGFFMAAAGAGYLSGVVDIAMPLTNKNLAGFTILRDRLFRPIIEENLTAAGACLVKPVAGGGSVIWGKTTTQSFAAEEQEISIVFIRDRVAKSLRLGTKEFVGQKDSPVFQGGLMERVNGLFQSFISQGLITDYRDLRVTRDPVEPRQWNIVAQVQPVYSVNWIYIRVGIGVLN